MKSAAIDQAYTSTIETKIILNLITLKVNLKYYVWNKLRGSFSITLTRQIIFLRFVRVALFVIR